MNTIKIDKYFKGMVANKGLSGIETENTIFSFLAASNRSFYGISCNVSLSKDNQIIVTNDDTLLRLGLLNLDIPSFSYDELRKFSLIDRKTANLDSNLYIPKLVDYLAICKTYRKVAFIHIKSTFKSENLDRMVDDINNYYDLKNSILISDNKKHLTHLVKNVDHNNIFYSTNKVNEETFDFCKKNGFNLNLPVNKVQKDIIKNMHLFGLKVSTGVVNDKDLAEKLIKYDIDYVFTDILE
ncbi:glycerophosphodiester phosphodiesterase family protein [Candidatus Izemoplasma sp. B36]|uniref:glycerophosphodiester phosphodiesterase family protein n=1 Tax=Candidatus Izemoplasma sp. B36 TaxID=3242468 RepID=UPI003558ADE2